jgi:hypothetical protein
MRKILVSLGAAAALLLSNSAVRADIINFGYTASSAVNPVDGSNSLYNTNNPMKTSSIQFTPANGAATYDGTTGVATQFIVYNMKTVSTATAGPGTYDTFSAVPFNLGITLTDLATGQQQSLNYSGTYSADHVSSSSSHVDPSTQGITWTTPLTNTQAIGNNTYTMQIVSWTAPGAPGSPGSILAEITAVPGAGGVGGGPPSAPEPASLLLAGLAVPALFAARRRMKKAAA